jgi:hypothetical protein
MLNGPIDPSLMLSAMRGKSRKRPELRLSEALERLEPGAREELLLVLTSPAHVRADLIRQCFERVDTEDLGELLIDIEEDDFVKAAVIETLHAMS